MSTQSIKVTDRNTYIEKAESELDNLSDQYFYYKKFRLGGNVDRDKIRFYMQNLRLLTTGNCELNNYIKDKIEGKLEDCGKKVKKDSALKDLLVLMEEETKKDTCTIINEACSWGSLAW